MLYIIAGITYGLCFFIVPIWAYRKGLQDGLNITQHKPIEPIKPQIKSPFKQAKTNTGNDKMLEGLMNIMSYDGTPQKVVDED